MVTDCLSKAQTMIDPFHPFCPNNRQVSFMELEALHIYELEGGFKA